MSDRTDRTKSLLERVPYEPPRLIVLGTLTEPTQSGSGGFMVATNTADQIGSGGIWRRAAADPFGVDGAWLNAHSPNACTSWLVGALELAAHRHAKRRRVHERLERESWEGSIPGLEKALRR